MNLAHFGYQSQERRLTAAVTESTHARILLLIRIYYTVHIWVGISRQTKNKNSLSDCTM